MNPLMEENLNAERTRVELSNFIQKEQYVGEVFSIAYDSAKVLIHDHHRRNVGGIPALCFLLATRIDPDKGVESDALFAEDSSVILLRVMDATPLPDNNKAEEIRVDMARDVAGETGEGTHMEQKRQDMERESEHTDEKLDPSARYYYGYAGVECRILGTFYAGQERDENGKSASYLAFGSDISNYYPNRGLKVYKPAGGALEKIVNYIRPVDRRALKASVNISLGNVRYASTNRANQNIDGVPVKIYPEDLLTQKTAVFSMTRIGKSNTMKIIAKSVYDLRKGTEGESLRIGQIIFDLNGEYANETVQDNNTALKNVWQQPEIKKTYAGKNAGKIYSREVATYSVEERDYDKENEERKLMKLNFFLHSNLQMGKEIIDDMLSGDSAKYIQNFRDVDLEPPENFFASVRYKRRVLFYRALLYKAGFETALKPSTEGLFGNGLLEKMREEKEFKDAADIFGENEDGDEDMPDVSEANEVSWSEIASAAEALRKFIAIRGGGYSAFNKQFQKTSKEEWADGELKKLLAMFQYENGANSVGRAKIYHSGSVNVDYAESIYEDLKKGKLVIIDQSTGNPSINADAALRIMTKIFNGNQDIFRQAGEPPHILMYIEEAHNILPSDKEADMKNMWVRAAKEGAKFNIGMVYSTQEVSTIQRNILKNTANWFIGHLNNTDETRELKKYYDFADFEKSILRAQDKGFLRIKTLSNPFVVPVQVNKFEIEGEE